MKKHYKIYVTYLIIFMNILSAYCTDEKPAEYTILSYPIPEDTGTPNTLTDKDTYKPGEKARFSAVPAEGYRFRNWTENYVVIGNDSILEYIAGEKHTVLYGNFEPIEEVSDTIFDLIIPDGWDYLAGEVSFGSTWIDNPGGEGTNAYIRRKVSNEKVLLVTNSLTYSNHLAKMRDYPLLEIRDRLLWLKAAATNNQNPVPDDARLGSRNHTGIHYEVQKVILSIVQ